MEFRIAGGALFRWLALSILIGLFTHWAIGLLAAILVFAKFLSDTNHIVTDENGASNGRPFWARFGDTFKQPNFYPDKPAVKRVTCSIEGDLNFDHEVSGESHHRIQIWACIPPEYAKQDKFRIYFIFTLEPEDDNEHDPNAVAVKLKGTVGYIPKANAKKFRKWAESQNITLPATCRGVIVGNKGRDYSIWLDLPY